MCHWPVGPTAPRSSPGWEEAKFGWRKELGDALVRCPQRPLVVRPEGRREAGKVQIQWIWEAVGRKGFVRKVSDT